MAFAKLACNIDTKGHCKQRDEALFLNECHQAPSQDSLVQ